MNLHITPSFIIDRLCKTASVLLFLVHDAHWKPFCSNQEGFQCFVYYIRNTPRTSNSTCQKVIDKYCKGKLTQAADSSVHLRDKRLVYFKYKHVNW